MRQNISPISGIPYGVIDARKCQWLWETIVNEGRDTTVERYEEQVRKDITENLSYELGKYEATTIPYYLDESMKFYDFVKDLLGKLPVWQTPARVHAVAEDVVANRYDPASNTFSISEVVEMIWEHYMDDLVKHGMDDTTDHTFHWTD